MKPIITTNDHETLIILCEIVSDLAYLARCKGWNFDHIEGADEIINLVEKE